MNYLLFELIDTGTIPTKESALGKLKASYTEDATSQGRLVRTIDTHGGRLYDNAITVLQLKGIDRSRVQLEATDQSGSRSTAWVWKIAPPARATQPTPPFPGSLRPEDLTQTNFDYISKSLESPALPAWVSWRYLDAVDAALDNKITGRYLVKGAWSAEKNVIAEPVDDEEYRIEIDVSSARAK